MSLVVGLDQDAGGEPVQGGGVGEDPDLLKRDFTSAAANERYVGDITYLPLADGTNLYLATVIDCYSRRLVGWAVADHMRTELVEDALKAAAGTRGSLAGAIFHSDHGLVYCSKDSCHRGVSLSCLAERVEDRLGGRGDRVCGEVVVAGDADRDLLDGPHLTRATGVCH